MVARGKNQSRRGVKGESNLPPAVNFLLSVLHWDNKMAFTFEKLVVYQKAVDFADKICSLTCKFPATKSLFQPVGKNQASVECV